MGIPNNVHTFIGCDSPYEESQIVLFGAPYDCTSSYRPGSRFAGAAIRNESYGIETYSPYQDKDLTDYKIFDSGEIELPFGGPEPALELIESRTAQILADGKLPFMIGGEHLVTLGAVRAVVKKYPDLRIIHFDAHTDLRDDYLGTKLSHATVMRRCYELTGDGRIYQFGIRSGDRPEFLWAKSHTCLHKFDFTGLEEEIKAIGTAPVYFSIDMDVLDPSEFPGTGTPEAGGVTFLQLLEAIRKVTGHLQIVGADMNERSPPWDPSGRSTALACKIVRELLLSLFK